MKNKNGSVKIVCLIIIAILICIAIVANKNKKSNNNSKINDEKIEINQAYDIDDITSSDVKIEKTKNVEIASKYTIDSNSIYKSEETVMFEDRKGTMFYVRDGENDMNIYQTKYYIDPDDAVSIRAREYMEEFRHLCESYIGPESESTETVYDKTVSDYELPTEEEVMLNNKLYNISFVDNSFAKYESEIEGETSEITEIETEENVRKYEINFYKKDNYLMCEFVIIK